MAANEEEPNDLFYLNEHPKIDAALKSFYSWFVSKEMLNDQSLFSSEILLKFTRRLSQSINKHIAPISNSNQTISKVWNEIQTRQVKPTKWLGKCALRSVWPDLEFPPSGDATEDDHWKAFIGEFERILMTESGDTQLIWAADGGRAELDKRSRERSQRAQIVTKSSTPFIQELPD